MAFTALQLASLEAAAASGHLRVQMGDKAIQYQSLDQLLQAIAQARADVAAQTTPTGNGALRYRVCTFPDG